LRFRIFLFFFGEGEFAMAARDEMAHADVYDLMEGEFGCVRWKGNEAALADQHASGSAAPGDRAKPRETEEKPKGGRPRVLDEVKRGEVCALLAYGCTFRAAAQYVGCSVSAISMLKERDPAFREQVDKALAQRQTIPLANMREAAKRSWRAAAWLLERTEGRVFKRDGLCDAGDLAAEAERETIDETISRKPRGVIKEAADLFRS
jgi:hypothetical protein